MQKQIYFIQKIHTHHEKMENLLTYLMNIEFIFESKQRTIEFDILYSTKLWKHK